MVSISCYTKIGILSRKMPLTPLASPAAASLSLPSHQSPFRTSTADRGQRTWLHMAQIKGYIKCIHTQNHHRQFFLSIFTPDTNPPVPNISSTTTRSVSHNAACGLQSRLLHVATRLSLSWLHNHSTRRDVGSLSKKRNHNFTQDRAHSLHQR